MTPVEQQTLHSSNPVLCRPQFGRQGGRKTAAGDPLDGVPLTRSRTDAGPHRAREHSAGLLLPVLVAGDLMTLDDVLPRLTGALAATALGALAAWTLLPVVPLGAAESYGVAAVLGTAAAALVVSQRRENRPSALRTLAFAVLQGLFLGVLSATLPGPAVLVQPVLGTMTTTAGVLLAYRLHWMRAHRRTRGFAGAGLLGLGLLAVADRLLVSVVGQDALGLRPLGLGFATGLAGAALAASFLALHLRQVEDAIRFGASRDRCWPAVFGLTLTLSWLYVETVRLLTLYPAEECYGPVGMP
ncbi:Bax inhibitor-1/YccA family membrane protein [Actinacidiphila rubida]|uniref:Uncharacterized membrane protein, YccA/Bax inhibitor family n=1 Tax=Actinacidiphila rubida TaxID=310780 RepID=A0A1H8RZ93_9ACTN|nr:Bax inhibitor-1/YccA family protein [Actinacidiphila rubida]SEO71751.1 Uncharacterized membrane protein, YccA/Bax inhibitor family [Actinacidiphila rubida]